MNANWFAYFALISWPVVAILFYKSLPRARATVLTVFCALLVLPSVASIKIQMIPSLDKNSIPTLCALVGCLLVGQPSKRVGPALDSPKFSRWFTFLARFLHQR